MRSSLQLILREQLTSGEFMCSGALDKNYTILYFILSYFHSRVEIKDVCLAREMQRVMAAEAEATRDARAKVTTKVGHFLRELRKSAGDPQRG